jgi:citrate synthase
MAEQATLVVDGKNFEYPIITGTRGERAIDIQRLRDQTGLITLDPGLNSTGSCLSSITFIDGEKGILLYRGIPIEQFKSGPNFMEVAYLLIFGHLPTADEYERFSNELTRHAHLHEGMRHHFEGFPIDSPPMAMLSAMINVLACYHQEVLQMETAAGFEEATARLISKIRTIAAYSYRRSQGLPFIYPDQNLRYCANFLHMMFSMPYSQHFIDEEVEQALNLLFILHADHEQNCSTSTVRSVGSSRANLFASVAAGVSALWGRLHGGANVEVLEMLAHIQTGGWSVRSALRWLRTRRTRSGSPALATAFTKITTRAPRC